MFCGPYDGLGPWRQTLATGPPGSCPARWFSAGFGRGCAAIAGREPGGPGSRPRTPKADGEPGLGEPGRAVVGFHGLPGLGGVGFLAALELGDAEADLHQISRAGIHVALGQAFLEEIDRLGIVALGQVVLGGKAIGAAIDAGGGGGFARGKAGSLVRGGLLLDVVDERLVLGDLGGVDLGDRIPRVCGFDRNSATAGGLSHSEQFVRLQLDLGGFHCAIDVELSVVGPEGRLLLRAFDQHAPVGVVTHRRRDALKRLVVFVHLVLAGEGVEQDVVVRGRRLAGGDRLVDGRYSASVVLRGEFFLRDEGVLGLRAAIGGDVGLGLRQGLGLVASVRVTACEHLVVVLGDRGGETASRLGLLDCGDAARVILDRGVAAGGNLDLLDSSALLGARSVSGRGISLLDGRAPLAAGKRRLSSLDVFHELFLRGHLGLGGRSHEAGAGEAKCAHEAKPNRGQAVAHGFAERLHIETSTFVVTALRSAMSWFDIAGRALVSTRFTQLQLRITAPDHRAGAVCYYLSEMRRLQVRQITPSLSGSSDDAHLLETVALGSGHHVSNHAVLGLAVRFDVDLGLHVPTGLSLEVRVELCARDRRAHPVDGVVEADHDPDRVRQVFRRRRLVRRRRERRIKANRVTLRRQRDDEHDQQHQHDVDQRSRVDLRERLAFCLFAN
jgi:hypothetical protein